MYTQVFNPQITIPENIYHVFTEANCIYHGILAGMWYYYTAINIVMYRPIVNGSLFIHNICFHNKYLFYRVQIFRKYSFSKQHGSEERYKVLPVVIMVYNLLKV